VSKRTRLPVNGRSLGELAMRAARTSGSAAWRNAPFPLRAPTVPNGVTPLRPKAKLGADYDTEWARSYPARLARVLMVEGLVRPAMDILAAPKVDGLDRLHDLDGAVIFAANHHSHVDTPLLLATIPEPWQHHLAIAAGADYFFGNRLTAPLSALAIGAIPIERNKVNRKSADDAAALLDEGWSLLIFPEGGRSPDGWGQTFRPGAAYLALRCGVPVVPIHLEGTGDILRKGRTFPKPGRTTITFGAPLRPTDGEDSRSFATRIQATVEQLADETTTDWYSARKRAHAGVTPSLVGPEAVGAWRRTWQLGANTPKRARQQRSWPKL